MTATHFQLNFTRNSDSDYVHRTRGKNEKKKKCDFLKPETLTSRRSVELDHKLIESTEDGDLVFALDADSWSRKKAVARNK